ncbi:MAG: hypothetical protein K6F53_07470 [Lachnospiraceae bacterium]|nr:hypothetical protein [Lachnospiraceae bacterium]
MKKRFIGMILSAALTAALVLAPLPVSAANTVDTASVNGSSSSALIFGTDVIYTAQLPKKPASDDGKIYLYELKTYQYSIPDGASPIASADVSDKVDLTFPLNHTGGYSRLYNKFVLAVKRNGVLTLVNNAQYITNPEACATEIKLREPRPVKLLQEKNVSNISLTGGGALTNVPSGAQHAVFTNTDPSVVTADPGALRAATDPHYVKNNPVVAYMLNADDDAGIEGLIADMTYHASNGNIQDFVIGNEVNERCWNYMDWTDWNTYVRKYVQAFRVCYTAIKSTNPNAMVYTSLDQVWNKNPQGADSYEYLDGDEFLAKFNDMIVENGNIDWNLSIHPYPNPLYWAKFWDPSSVANGASFKAQVDKNQVITFENMTVITNLLCTSKYLNRSGMVRDVIIGEIGMGSNAGVDNQAAAICASYAAFEMNPFVTQYMYLEVDVNGFFPTLTGKALEAYNAMGTPEEGKYMSWALDHIGIKDWKQVIHGYD